MFTHVLAGYLEEFGLLCSADDKRESVDVRVCVCVCVREREREF